MDIRSSAGGWLIEHFGSQNWDSKMAAITRIIATLKRPITKLEIHVKRWQVLYRQPDVRQYWLLARDGVGFEDLMRPDSTLNWAPIIRGVAETNARITVHPRWPNYSSVFGSSWAIRLNPVAREYWRRIAGHDSESDGTYPLFYRSILFGTTTTKTRRFALWHHPWDCRWR